MSATRLPVSPGLHRFKGGLRFDEHHKESTREPIAPMPLVERYILPLKQHIGAPAEPCVRAGERVLKGQTLARPTDYVSAAVHAPTSGVVRAIEAQPVPHPSGLPAPCIVLEADGDDRWIEREPLPDFRSQSPGHLRNLIREAGLVGLGGAAFPSAVKLNVAPERRIDTLIVNAAECEPYIHCDAMLIRERAEALLDGIAVARHCLGEPRCLIGIEDHQVEAHAALVEALARRGEPGIEIRVIPTVYPTGGEKQLIQVLTGRRVPRNGLPADVGVVCHNVGTLYAVGRAVLHGEPLIGRIVTVTGPGVARPGHLEVPIGTPVAAVIAARGGYTPSARGVIMGGHMMGFALHSDAVPVVKASNCLLVADGELLPDPPPPERPCIRCGLCEQVCPAELLPQQLLWYARAGEHDKAMAYDLFDCIECGCCAYVCPSHIPLVQYYRHAKTEIAHARREREKADQARRRFEARKARLARETEEKAAKARERKRALADEAGKRKLLDAALARAGERRGGEE